MRRGARKPADAQSTMKLMRRFTRHSVMVPSGPHLTLVSLIQAPLMFLTVSAHLRRPDCTASSTLLVDEELSSMILATAMGRLRQVDGAATVRSRRERKRERPR